MKYNIDIPKNHISSLISPAINEMLDRQSNRSPIRYFDYQRIYNTNEMLCLTSNIDFLSARIKLNVPFVEPALTDGTFLADEVFPVPEKELDHQHNMYTGLCFVKKHENFTETTFFATDNQNRNCVSFYLNNIDYLNNFIFEFKDNFHHVIAQAEKNKIAFPNNLNPIAELSENFVQYSEVSIAKELIDVLSEKERITLNHLLKGKTQEEIAEILMLSRSSVSTYINRIMHKFGCKRRSDLINIAWQHGLIRSKVLD